MRACHTGRRLDRSGNGSGIRPKKKLQVKQDGLLDGVESERPKDAEAQQLEHHLDGGHLLELRQH